MRTSRRIDTELIRTVNMLLLPARAPLIAANTYLHLKAIHCLVASQDAEVRKTVLSSYFLAHVALRENKANDIPSGPHTALLTAVAAKKASVFALFGGQGSAGWTSP